MTVYVISDQKMLDFETDTYISKYDYTPAKEFGEIEFLLSPTANPFGNIDSIVSELHSKLKHTTHQDYLVLSGNPALIGAAVAIMALYNDGLVCLLQWDGYHRKYNEISFKINSKLDEITANLK